MVLNWMKWWVFSYSSYFPHYPASFYVKFFDLDGGEVVGGRGGGGGEKEGHHRSADGA